MAAVTSRENSICHMKHTYYLWSGCLLLQNRTCSKIVPTYLALLKSFSLSFSSSSILRVCFDISDLRNEIAGCIIMVHCCLPRNCLQVKNKLHLTPSPREVQRHRFEVFQCFWHLVCLSFLAALTLTLE